MLEVRYWRLQSIIHGQILGQRNSRNAVSDLHVLEPSLRVESRSVLEYLKSEL